MQLVGEVLGVGLDGIAAVAGEEEQAKACSYLVLSHASSSRANLINRLLTANDYATCRNPFIPE